MNSMTPVVKNLIIINVLFYFASVVFESNFGVRFSDFLALHYVQASNFGIWQLVSYMFLHASLSHLFFNMFTLYMFGVMVERTMGVRRFLIYYFATGIGAGIVQEVALFVDLHGFYAQVDDLLSNVSAPGIESFLEQCPPFSQESAILCNQFVKNYNSLLASSPAEALSSARTFLLHYQQLYVDAQATVGASGAGFGVLLAAAMLFPNHMVMLLIPPIPLKMKWLVLGYGLIELFEGVNNFQYDNVAHWAHLGGMLFGFLLIRRWMSRRWV